MSDSGEVDGAGQDTEESNGFDHELGLPGRPTFLK